MTDDSFSFAVPEGRTVETDVDTDEASIKTVYESPNLGRRVAITEFVRGLTLYWWVDIFAFADGEWHRREVSFGDSYRDVDAVSDATQDALDRLASSGERIESVADDWLITVTTRPACMHLVAYDGSRPASAVLGRAAQFASATGHDVLAVTVIPNDSAYAVEAGWVPSQEVPGQQTVVEELHETTVDIASSASFQAVTVGRDPAPGNIVAELRMAASETDATVIFVDSENAGRVVVPLVSVGGNVASDDDHNVHIVRHVPPEVHRRFPKSHFYLP